MIFAEILLKSLRKVSSGKFLANYLALDVIHPWLCHAMDVTQLTIFGFLTFLWGIEMKHWTKMGQWYSISGWYTYDVHENWPIFKNPHPPSPTTIKDPIPNYLKSLLVYKFTFASCSSSYIDKTFPHFNTRTEEHIKKDNKSHIFKHLHSTATCFDSYYSLCFKIIDKVNSKFNLRIKEALHINWRKPNFNAQQNHLALTLSL